jgi:NodT family efflux transporter outer membrane factor (OMF) lipoprotein
MSGARHPAQGLAVVLAALLAACRAGPDYVRPGVETPPAYKEARDWKPARPDDAAARGDWWQTFGDPQLGALIAQLDVSNQSIAAAEAQWRQALAIAAEARAAWWPTIDASAQVTRSRASATTGAAAGGGARTLYSLPLSLSWEADLWGRIARSVEQGEAGAAASAADLVNARLSAQAALAQSYFQLRALDSQKSLLDETVAAYAKTLELTKNRYAVGVASRADIAAAEAQLQSTRAQALDTALARAQLEHAVAVLLGKPASGFTLAAGALAAAPPPVPSPGLPAALLERRPDVAAAERRVAAANAGIGVARAAFFPDATLGASFGLQSASAGRWFSAPSRFWSLGPALALTLLDGGRRAALSDEALAVYDQTVAGYRGTVLGAFREVEDSLAALRLLQDEAAVQAGAAKAAALSLRITLDQYRAGTVNYLQVVQAQTADLAARRAAVDIQGRRLVAAVQLIKALGGGWDGAKGAGPVSPLAPKKS